MGLLVRGNRLMMYTSLTWGLWMLTIIYQAYGMSKTVEKADDCKSQYLHNSHLYLNADDTWHCFQTVLSSKCTVQNMKRKILFNLINAGCLLYSLCNLWNQSKSDIIERGSSEQAGVQVQAGMQSLRQNMTESEICLCVCLKTSTRVFEFCESFNKRFVNILDLMLGCPPVQLHDRNNVVLRASGRFRCLTFCKSYVSSSVSVCPTSF